jgi:hypothetical protein
MGCGEVFGLLSCDKIVSAASPACLPDTIEVMDAFFLRPQACWWRWGRGLVRQADRGYVIASGTPCARARRRAERTLTMYVGRLRQHAVEMVLFL